MAEIGFIGMGNMGYALLKGVLKEFPAEKLIFTVDFGDQAPGSRGDAGGICRVQRRVRQ